MRSRSDSRVGTLSMVMAGSVLAMLALAGCTPFQNGPSAGSIADPEAVTDWTERNNTTIDWGECDLSIPEEVVLPEEFNLELLQCATVQAPVDWKKPTGKTAEIAVLRVLPTGELKGHIFTNPGGPGASSAGLAAQMMASAAAKDVREHYAFVGIEPRGVKGPTGGSEPIECGDETELKSCSSKLIRHASTAETAFDMEYLRQLLKEPKLDYLGYSYGTYLGAVYATIFPDTVGNMILDSATSPQYGSTQNEVRSVLGFEGAIDRFLGACVGGELGACPFTGTIPEAKTQLNALRDRLNAQPEVYGDVTITGETLQEAMIGPFYGPRSEWENVAAQLNGLATKNLPDPSFFTTNMEVSHKYSLAITCATAAAAAEPADSAPPTFPAENFLTPDEDEEVSCDTRNRPAWTDPAINYSGKSTILIISGTQDPATPISDARDLRRALKNAKLVAVEGEGHGWSLGGRSACVDGLASRFLVEGKLPDREYCVAEQG